MAELERCSDDKVTDVLIALTASGLISTPILAGLVSRAYGGIVYSATRCHTLAITGGENKIAYRLG